MSAIEIRNLSHRFSDGSVGIDGVNLTIAEGEFVTLLGANGSGKTTLLRHLNGLLRPTGGSVMIKGRSVAADPGRARRLVGMVFQDADTQIVGETVYEDAAFGPTNLGWDPEQIRRRTVAALSAVGLADMGHRPCHRLSGGEKRRLAVAGALAMGAETLILDEPFANLDHIGARQVLATLGRLRDRGRTVLLATHDLDRVAARVGRVVVMSCGRVARDGRLGDLLPDLERYGVQPPCPCRLAPEDGERKLKMDGTARGADTAGMLT